MRALSHSSRKKRLMRFPKSFKVIRTGLSHKYRKCRVTASNAKYVVKFTGYGNPKASLAKSILGLWTIDKGKCGQKAANH